MEHPLEVKAESERLHGGTYEDISFGNLNLSIKLKLLIWILRIEENA